MLSKALILLPTITAALAECAPRPISQPAGTDKNYTITVGPHDRSYMVFVPKGASSTSGNPLIFSFHGNTKSDWQQEQLSQMSNPEFNTDHIVVYPQGYENHWQPGPYAIPSASDLDFMAALLPRLQSDFPIDSKRIYAAGKSVGGGFVGSLACDPHLGPKFAAFAPVSGAFYWDTPQNHTNCNPGKRSSTPMLEFHGLNDTTIPYIGGEHNGVDLPDIGTWAGWWKVRNGCSSSQSPSVTEEYNGNVKKVVYEGCEMVHYKINNLGHDWPSTQPNFDNPDGTYLNATPIIMDWFRGHSLG